MIPRLVPLTFVVALLLLAPFATNAQITPPAPPATNSQINWNPASLTLVAAGGNYARMIRLRDHQIACVYELGPKIFLRRSADEGHTWTEPQKVAEWAPGALANPYLLALRDGSLICFYNQRPHNAHPPAPGSPHFAIGMTTSTDGGATFSPTKTIFEGGLEFGSGVWEPAAVELPSGPVSTEIELYFANETRYVRTHEQEISLMTSTDGGKQWSSPRTVSFRAGARDGMPNPVVLRDGSGIAVAIEDNGLSGNFKPVVVFSEGSQHWHDGPVSAMSAHRWGALTKPLPPNVYAGAPFLCQMPGGATVISFQQAENPDTEHTARMAVSVGDAHARHFGPQTFPFQVTPGHGQMWNALFAKDARTVTAITGTTENGTAGIWAIDGEVPAPPSGGSGAGVP